MSGARECPPLISQIILSEVDLGSTMGAVNIGAYLSAVAYGITCCQAFYYYRSSKFKQDSWSLKALVGFLMVLVTLQQAFIFETCYDYLVTHYGDPCALLEIFWPGMTSILLESIVGLFVKCFLAHRVWMLSHNLYVTCFCAVAVSADFGVSLAVNIKGYKDPSLSEDTLFGLKPEAMAAFGLAIFADMVLVVSILFYLYRSRTGMRRSNNMISKLMVLTVSTGLLTTIVILIGLILNTIYPEALYSAAIEFILGKLYMNSLLTTYEDDFLPPFYPLMSSTDRLNMRETLLAHDRFDNSTLMMNTIPVQNVNDSHRTRAAQEINVKISRTVDIEEDPRKSTSSVEKYAVEIPRVLGADARNMC